MNQNAPLATPIAYSLKLLEAICDTSHDLLGLLRLVEVIDTSDNNHTLAHPK